MTTTDQSDEEDAICKLLCIGDSNVGKTSLLWRFDGDKVFKDYIPKYENDPIKKHINNSYMMLEYWDIPRM